MQHTILYSTLLCPALLYSTIPYPTLLYSAMLYYTVAPGTRGLAELQHGLREVVHDGVALVLEDITLSNSNS